LKELFVVVVVSAVSHKTVYRPSWIRSAAIFTENKCLTALVDHVRSIKLATTPLQKMQAKKRKISNGKQETGRFVPGNYMIVS
jgi:hypothetical protein